jgi:hypothetical protein
MTAVFGVLVALSALGEAARWLLRTGGWKLSLPSTVAQYAECIWSSYRRNLFIALLVSFFPILAGCWILGLSTLLGLLLWCSVVMNELLPPTYLLLGSSKVTGDGLRKRFRWFHREKAADLLQSESRWSRLLSLRNRNDQRWQHQLVALAAVSMVIVVDVDGDLTTNVMREIIWVLDAVRNQTCFVGDTKSQALQEMVKGHPPFVLGKPPLRWITNPANLLAELRSAIPIIAFDDTASLRARTARWPF